MVVVVVEVEAEGTLEVRLLNWGAWVDGAPIDLPVAGVLTFLSQGFNGVAMLLPGINIPAFTVQCAIQVKRSRFNIESKFVDTPTNKNGDYCYRGGDGDRRTAAGDERGRGKLRE